MTEEPTNRPTTPRTLTVTGPGRAKLAVAVAAALAVACVPASQALASAAHKPAPKDPGVSASRAGDGERGRGDGGDRGRKGPKAEPCGSFDEKNWWPFGNALHGSTVIETKDGGIQPSNFQRGIVQSVSDTQVTVLSKDNYLGTWTLTDATAIWRFGHRGAAADLGAGQCVGLWGSAGTPDAPVAKFVVIKWVPRPGTSPSASPSGSPSSSPSVSPSVSASPSGSVSPTASPSGAI